MTEQGELKGLLDEVLAERGKTALVVIDVQNDFCAEGGWFSAIGYDLRDIDQATAKLAEFLPKARRAGVRVYFVQAIYDEVYLSEPMLRRHRRRGLPIAHCLSGTWGAEFFRVAPQAEDLVIVKHRYSAFIDTELNALLRAQRARTLILAGVTSNVCVESTARDGFMLDYDIVFVSDCSATYDPRLHESTLENIERSFGVVSTADDVVASWRRTGALRRREDSSTSVSATGRTSGS